MLQKVQTKTLVDECLKIQMSWSLENIQTIAIQSICSCLSWGLVHQFIQFIVIIIIS
jgi:hypothetical protein